RLRAKTVLRMGFLSNGCVRRATAMVRQSLAAADSLVGLVRSVRGTKQRARGRQISPSRAGDTPHHLHNRAAAWRSVSRGGGANYGSALGYTPRGFTKRRVMRS